MRKKQQKAALQQAETLKAYCWEQLDLYHEGAIQAPEAKLNIANALHTILLSKQAHANVGWLRVQVPAKAGVDNWVLAAAERVPGVRVLTVRRYGPREEGQPSILFLAVKASAAERISYLAEALESAEGVQVRDWSFGLNIIA